MPSSRKIAILSRVANNSSSTDRLSARARFEIEIFTLLSSNTGSPFHLSLFSQFRNSASFKLLAIDSFGHCLASDRVEVGLGR